MEKVKNKVLAKKLVFGAISMVCVGASLLCGGSVKAAIETEDVNKAVTEIAHGLEFRINDSQFNIGNIETIFNNTLKRLDNDDMQRVNRVSCNQLKFLVAQIKNARGGYSNVETVLTLLNHLEIFFESLSLGKNVDLSSFRSVISVHKGRLSYYISSGTIQAYYDKETGELIIGDYVYIDECLEAIRWGFGSNIRRLHEAQAAGFKNPKEYWEVQGI